MKAFPGLLLGVLPILVGGCIHHTETVVRDEVRMPVNFENDAAGRIFYEALSRMPEPRHGKEGTTRYHIPVVFSYEETVKTGESHRFNAAVRRADTNQDGNITETEARIFSETVH